jgi:CheY-like chemotaxis protein
VVNVLVNAVDAAEGAGDAARVQVRIVVGDKHVEVRVSDEGHGVPHALRPRLFEPRFTTKEPGKGTGLGLATVHSTVRESGGFVAIDSAVGEGTSVHLYFPKAEPGPIVSRARSFTKPPLGRGELILLVEDNDKVREATVSRLESLGYAVLKAKTGPEAITLLESGQPIALVFSDIVMPGGMTGYDVAEWVLSMKPDLKVLLTSGYSDMQHTVREAVREIKVLGKPYTRDQLACALREALDG